MKLFKILGWVERALPKCGNCIQNRSRVSYFAQLCRHATPDDKLTTGSQQAGKHEIFQVDAMAASTKMRSCRSSCWIRCVLSWWAGNSLRERTVLRFHCRHRRSWFNGCWTFGWKMFWLHCTGCIARVPDRRSQSGLAHAISHSTGSETAVTGVSLALPCVSKGQCQSTPIA